MEILFALFLIILLVAFYFLPSVIAVQRKHRNRIPIILVNVFFGWFVVGWIAALVWAFTANQETA
jgi:hypothetical protein